MSDTRWRITMLFVLILVVSYGFGSLMAPDGMIGEYEVPEWMQRVTGQYVLFGLVGMILSLAWPHKNGS